MISDLRSRGIQQVGSWEHFCRTQPSPRAAVFQSSTFTFRLASIKPTPLGSRTHAKIGFMQVRVNVPDRLAAEAQERGISLELYVEQVLAQQVIAPEEQTDQESVNEAIDRIRELRKQNKLDGLRTKDLIH